MRPTTNYVKTANSQRIHKVASVVEIAQAFAAAGWLGVRVDRKTCASCGQRWASGEIWCPECHPVGASQDNNDNAQPLRGREIFAFGEKK